MADNTHILYYQGRVIALTAPISDVMDNFDYYLDQAREKIGQDDLAIKCDHPQTKVVFARRKEDTAPAALAPAS